MPFRILCHDNLVKGIAIPLPAPRREGEKGDSTANIKAIETLYNGYKFRSRLEARWAVFFDAIGMRYEYEQEGFALSDGVCYLPDFYLPDCNVYVEVKPLRDNVGKELVKPIKFCENSTRLVLFLPNIPDDNAKPWWWFPIMYYHPLAEDVVIHRTSFGVGDNEAFLWRDVFPAYLCRNCIRGRYGVVDGIGTKYMLTPIHDSELPYTPDDDGTILRMSDGEDWNPEKLRSAFTAARTARFEHRG